METVDAGKQYSKSEIIARSRSVIENDIKNTKTQLDKMSDRGNELYDNFSDDAKNKIDHVFISIIDNGQLSFLDKNKEIREILEEYDNQPDLVEAINLGFEIYKKEKELVSLKEECKPFVVENIKVFANSLSDRINFDKVVNYFLEKRDYEFVGNVISVEDILSLRVVVSGDNGNLEKKDLFSLYSLEESLKKIRNRCSNHSFLGLREKDNLSDEKNEEGQSVDKKSLLKEVDMINKELLETYTLHLIYRPTSSFKKDMGGFLKILDHHYYFDSEVDDSHYDPRFLKAIEKRFKEDEKKLRESGLLSQNDEEKKCFFESKREEVKNLRRMKILGLEATDDKKLAINEEEIIAFLEGTFPTAFLKIWEIEVSREKPKDDVDFSNDEDNTDQKTKGKIVGKALPILDKEGNMICECITIYESFEIDENDSEKKKLIIKRAFFDTLTHEIGHGVHNDLGVDELKKWENVMKDDETEISWYVGYAGTKSSLIKKIEDFCESFSLFVKDPKLLSILSLGRFQYMRELFVDYMDTNKVKRFKEHLDLTLKLSEVFMEANGYTEEYLRNIFIPKKQ